MANRSKAFANKQRDSHNGWQPAAPRAFAGLLVRSPEPVRFADLDHTRSVLVDMGRFKEILADDPNLSVSRIIQQFVMPTIRDSALSYRRHEMVVVQEAPPCDPDDMYGLRQQARHGMAFTFKRSRHAMLFKLMWG